MTFKGLRLIEASAPPKRDRPQARRARLIRQIDRQMALAQAAESGAGVSKSWWWTTDDGKFAIAARYGRANLELMKGKHAVICETISDVHMALDMIRSAAQRGEFDTQLAEIALTIRRNFARKSNY